MGWAWPYRCVLLGFGISYLLPPEIARLFAATHSALIARRKHRLIQRLYVSAYTDAFALFRHYEVLQRQLEAYS